MQFTENSAGLMDFNWYIILHTTITQAQTEDMVEAIGRSLAYGTANVHDARNTKFIKETYITKKEKHYLVCLQKFFTLFDSTIWHLKIFGPLFLLAC